MTPDERIAELEHLLARASQDLEPALARNAVLNAVSGGVGRDLEARLAKDSHSSHKPPPSDGLKGRLPWTRSHWCCLPAGSHTAGADALGLAVEAFVVLSRPARGRDRNLPWANGVRLADISTRSILDGTWRAGSSPRCHRRRRSARHCQGGWHRQAGSCPQQRTAVGSRQRAGQV